MGNINVKFNTLYHCLKYKVTQKRVPILISLSITNRCNLKCPFCYANSFNRTLPDFSTEKLCKIIDDFVDLGTQGIMLQGGEPLLRNDIAELITHVKKKSRFCSLTTNGTLLARNVHKLTGLDRLEVSVDGGKEIIETNRGEGSHDKIMEGLEAAHKAGLPFCVHALVSNDSTLDNTLLPILNIAKKYNTYATFCYITGTSEEIETNTIGRELKEKHIKDIYAELVHLKKEGYPVGNSFNVLHHTLNWPYQMAKVLVEGDMTDNKFSGPRCLYGKLSVYMDTDGTLYPCALSFHKKGFSENIFSEGGVKGAWERLTKLRCIHCGVSAEGTYLFSLKFEDLLNATKY